MYQNIDDFLEDWKEESASTLKVFSRVPDDKIAAKEHVDVRSLGRMAWHITQTVTEMPKSAGLTSEDPLENMEMPGNMTEITELYRKYCDRLIQTLEQEWKERSLSDEVQVYGQSWSLRKILYVLIKHQIHHRAQMTILMRLFNLKVPGLYGPAKEEWSEYGMDPQE